MASEARYLVDELTNVFLGGLVYGDGFETRPHKFGDGGQGGRCGGHGKWCWKFGKK